MIVFLLGVPGTQTDAILSEWIEMHVIRESISTFGLVPLTRVSISIREIFQNSTAHPARWNHSRRFAFPFWDDFGCRILTLFNLPYYQPQVNLTTVKSVTESRHNELRNLLILYMLSSFIAGGEWELNFQCLSLWLGQAYPQVCGMTGGKRAICSLFIRFIFALFSFYCPF
jgi:hypothetical protein